MQKFNRFIFNTGIEPKINRILERSPVQVAQEPEQTTDVPFNIAVDSIKTAPVYSADNFVADTEISHIDELETLVGRHLRLLNNLRNSVTELDDTIALRGRLKTFIDKWKLEDSDIQTELGAYYSDDDGDVSISLNSQNPDTATANIDNDAEKLLTISRYAMDDFHQLNTLRGAVLRLRRRKAHQLRSSHRQTAVLGKQIVQKRADFENAEKTRLKAEENYSIARGLLEDQLQAVDDAFAERQRILSQPLGLSFVRINDLPMQIEHHRTDLIAEPSAGRLPVSCSVNAELPERLEPFIELLLDQPMGSWQRLRPYWRLLPKEWITQPPVRFIPSLQSGIVQLPFVFQTLQNALPKLPRRAIEPKHRYSLIEANRRLADEVTLEQLQNTRNSRLRQRARRLHEELETATACFINNLLELPATLRYQWSRLAEEDALNTAKILAWPDFHEHASDATGLALREIHEWLHLQLYRNADSAARTAMRTLIRACLLHAVNDDPDDLLTGDVVEFPPLIKPGVLLNANLNRIPQLSSKLKLYDASRKLLAEAKVVDSKDTRASVEIVSVYNTVPDLQSAWKVIGQRAGFCLIDC